MKSKLKKALIAYIVIITIFNLLFATIAKAASPAPSAGTTVNSLQNEEESNLLEGLFGGLGVIVDGLVGILAKVIQIPLLLIGLAIHGLITGIASLDGASAIEGFITPDDVFFNRVGLTDISFFDISGSGNVINTIRTNIATWYYILRIFAVIILLAILVYVGIRMAISTVASDQARYKKMFTDWALSFAILFFLGYIILFTLEANKALVAMLGTASRVTIGDGVVTELVTDVASLSGTKSWAAFIVYFALLGMSLSFLFIYIKRMLTIGFLIIISPLITITYSIDKMKDGQAQALNTWMKEFFLMVLIQPFHIIIYLVFVSSTLQLLDTSPSLAKMLLSIVCMGFVWPAEKIVRNIFGFTSSQSLGETIAAMGMVNTIKDSAVKAAKSAGGAASKTKFGQNIQSKVEQSKVGQTYQKLSNSKAGGMLTKTVKNMGAAGMGAAAMGFEIGTGSPANALQVGISGYEVGKALFNPGPSQAQTMQQQTQNNEQMLKRYAEQIARNNNFNFANFNRGNQTHKNNLKNYAQSLIGANMNQLNNDITTALAQLTARNPGDYNTTSARGNQNILNLQQAALDPNLDFNDPSSNPLGRAWTNEEKQVITAIQIRNLAQAVNDTHTSYQNEGRSNPSQDIDSFIDGL